MKRQTPTIHLKAESHNRTFNKGHKVLLSVWGWGRAHCRITDTTIYFRLRLMTSTGFKFPTCDILNGFWFCHANCVQGEFYIHRDWVGTLGISCCLGFGTRGKNGCFLYPVSSHHPRSLSPHPHCPYYSSQPTPALSQ